MQDCKLPVFTPGRSQQPVWRTIFKTSEFVKHFTLARILSSILDHKDSKQFAVTGKLTEQALVYILHLALETVDKGNCSLRFFFVDFRKGFDLI